MANLLFAGFLYFYLFVTGILVCCALKIKRSFLIRQGLYLLPLVGVLALVNIIQVLNVLLTVRQITIGLLMVSAFGAVWWRKSVAECMSALWKDKEFLLLLLFTVLFFAAPLLQKDGLVSIQRENNDIMYYLSSMHWFREHRLTEPVVYSDRFPFYWCASYMLDRTRLGLDVFGAFVMTLLEADAAEIFSGIGVVFIMLSLGSVTFFSGYLLGYEGRTADAARRGPYICSKKALLSLLCLTAAPWSEMLSLQYVPQIFGIAALIAFVPVSVRFFTKPDRTGRCLTVLLLSGTVAVYAEYAVYLAAVFGITGLLFFWKHRREGLAFFKPALLTGALSLIVNPVGLYRAARLHLFVLTNLNGDMGNIDPYAGKILSVPDALAKAVGLCQSGEYTEGAARIAGIVLIQFAGLTLCLLFLYALYIKGVKKVYVVSLLGFLTVYEGYFHLTQYAYGEYKHLLTAAPFVVILLFFILDELGGWAARGSGRRLYHKWPRLLLLCWGCAAFLCGLRHGREYLAPESLYYYDSELNDIARGAELVPYGEPIGLSGSVATLHGAVYALRDRPSLILANNISYYPFSTVPGTRYRLYEGASEDAAQQNENIIWNNGRFTITENTGLQSCFYSGFHAPFDGEDTESRWTCDAESVIAVTNYADEEKRFSIKFDTASGPQGERKLRVLYEGRVIASGRSGELIITDTLKLAPGERKDIYLYTDGGLGQKDSYVVGFKLENFSLLEYSFGAS